MPEQVSLAVAERVATVTIERPEKRNALTWSMIEQLRRHMVDLRDDQRARVIVLRGEGDAAFCSGADLGTMADDTEFSELHEARGAMAGLFTAMWECGKPTIAAVRGFALAGGFGLALACDVVVAADDAVMGVPEIDVGLWPHMVTVPLTRSMPVKAALELMMTGRRITAAEALELGAVSRVVAADDLDEAVAALAADLATKPPVAMRLGRDAFYATLGRSPDDALRLLHSMLTVTASTAEAAEGLAAFREHRDPQWKQ